MGKVDLGLWRRYSDRCGDGRRFLAASFWERLLIVLTWTQPIDVETAICALQDNKNLFYFMLKRFDQVSLIDSMDQI